MSEYAVLGKRLPRVDALEKVTGSGQLKERELLCGAIRG